MHSEHVVISNDEGVATLSCDRQTFMKTESDQGKCSETVP